MQNISLQTIISLLPSLVWAVVIVLVFFLLGKFIARSLNKAAQRTHATAQPIFILLGRIINIFLVIVGAIMALSALNVHVPALIAGLGLTSLGLGFALKDPIINFFSGVLILVYRPFNLNDKVKLGDAVGIVTDIGFVYVTLMSGEDKILMPNSNFFNTAITIFKSTDS